MAIFHRFLLISSILAALGLFIVPEFYFPEGNLCRFEPEPPFFSGFLRLPTGLYIDVGEKETIIHTLRAIKALITAIIIGWVGILFLSQGHQDKNWVKFARVTISIVLLLLIAILTYLLAIGARELRCTWPL